MKKEKHLLSIPLLIAMGLFIVISCVAIASATPLIVYPSPETYWAKQAVFYGISFLLVFIVYYFQNDRLYALAWVIYGVLMVMLLGLAVDHFAYTRFGMHVVPLAKFVNGATSWYSLPGFDIQPSEFMKISLLLVLARTIQVHNTENVIHTTRSDLYLFFKALLICVPPCFLIYLQNETGVILIILVSIAFVLFSSGIQSKWFILFGICAVLGICIASYVYVYHHETFAAILGGDHKLGRFYGWLDPEGTYSHEGYQLFNALLAFGTSGITGHGFQSSIMPFPEAQTDFIFAVIAQGAGLIGGLVTLASIVYFDFTVLFIGHRSKNDIDKYFVSGLMGMLLFQQFWNIGMVVGLVPITGITLPFISYGGSSLLSYMIGIGILFNIEKQSRIVEGKNRYE